MALEPTVNRIPVRGTGQAALLNMRQLELFLIIPPTQLQLPGGCTHRGSTSPNSIRHIASLSGTLAAPSAA